MINRCILLLFLYCLPIFYAQPHFDVTINSSDDMFPSCAPGNPEPAENFIAAVKNSHNVPPYDSIPVPLFAKQWVGCFINREQRMAEIRVRVSSADPTTALVGFFYGNHQPPDILKKMEYKDMIFYDQRVAVCNRSCIMESQAFKVLCRKEGTARFDLSVELRDYGVTLSFPLTKTCAASELNYYGSEDLGHLFPPLGFLFYMTYVLLDHLNIPMPFGKLVPKALRRFLPSPADESDPKKRAIRKIRGEQLAFTICGTFLMIILSGDIVKILSHDFPKHLILGIFISLCGTLGLLLSSNALASKSFPFVTPMILLYLGFVFLVHEQYDYFSYVMHTAFGFSLMATGITRALSYVWPSLTVLTTLLGHFTGALFIGTDNGIVLVLQPVISPMNYIFCILNITVLYIMVVTAIAFFINRNKRVKEGHIPLNNLNGMDEKDEDYN